MCVLNNGSLNINFGRNKPKTAPTDILFFVDLVPLQNETRI